MIDSRWLLESLFANSYKTILDDYWARGDPQYYEKLAETKSKGFRVYRNGEGKHKVVSR